jgi:hypothetical protein
LKIRPLAVACIVSILLHGGVGYLVHMMDRTLRLQSNLHFSVYRLSIAHASPFANATNGRASVLTRHADMAMADRPLSVTENVNLSDPRTPDAEATGPAPLALDEYLEPDQVMVSATPIDIIDLNVAEGAMLNAPGTMTLKLWVDGSGKVVHTEIEKSDFPSAYSDAIAAVFGSAVFAPAQVQGLPVNSILRIETRYE